MFYDNQKVLVIYNTNPAKISSVDAGELDTFSSDIADWYIATRGLNAAHKYGVDLGTATKFAINPTNDSWLATLRTYIIDNAIQIVLLSAGCPHIATVSDYADDVTMDSYLGGISGYAAFSDRLSSAEYDRLTITYGSSETRFYSFEGVSWLDTTSLRPYGRIGYIAGSGKETTSETKRYVTDAMETEASITNYSDVVPGTMHFGMYDRSLPYITGIQSEDAALLTESYGIVVKRYLKTYSADWGVAPTFDYNSADMIDGLPAASETLFCTIGAAIVNEVEGSAWPGYYTWAKGAFTYEDTSFGVRTGQNCLVNGGCAAIGTVLEPYAINTPDKLEFIKSMLQGNPICIANGQADCRWSHMQSVIGDPLYAPFTNCPAAVDGNSVGTFNKFSAGIPPPLVVPTTFSNAPRSGALDGTEIIGATQGTNNVGITLNQLKEFIGAA